MVQQDEEHHSRTGVTSSHTKKELHQRLVQLQQSTDTSSSNDSLNTLIQSASHHMNENIIGIEAAGGAGPTTRRAWQDYCKSGNNSHHESHSEEDEGNLLYSKYMFVYPLVLFILNRKISQQEENWQGQSCHGSSPCAWSCRQAWRRCSNSTQ